MKITPKIEDLLKHAFPKSKTGQEEYIDLCSSIYCDKPAYKIDTIFLVCLSYGIHWDDSTKCTVFIKINPIEEQWIIPVPKDVPIKYIAGGTHQLYITFRCMTCSFPSSLWIECEICKTAFKNPIEMYNYILDTISVGVINPFSNENEIVFRQLSKLIGNIETNK